MAETPKRIAQTPPPSGNKPKPTPKMKTGVPAAKSKRTHRNRAVSRQKRAIKLPTPKKSDK